MSEIVDFIFEEDNEELRLLGNSVRKFARERIAKKQWDTLSYHRDDFLQMAELGLCGLNLAESVGGSNLEPLATAATIFELAREDLGPAVYLSVHLMVAGLVQRWSDENEHSVLLKDLADGRKLAAFALTEAQAGSDAAALKTKAEKTADGYLLNGEKIYITSAGVADVYLVFARSSSSERTKGISAFVVEAEDPGISFGPAEKKMGCEGSPISSVVLKDCLIPDSRLLAQEGEGYKIALSGLSGGRVNIGAAASGISAKALLLAREHAQQRKQFGQSIAEFQGIQFMLADMAIKLRASILLTRQAAIGLGRNSSKNIDASIAKCYASDSAMEITTDAVQIFGGAGYLQDYKVEKLMRDAKMLQIVEGTNQIQRLIVSRALLGINSST